MNKIINFIAENSSKESSDEILEFGIEMIKLSVTAIVIAIIIAVIYDMIPEALFFFVSFIPLRQNAGGYHAKNRYSCAILSVMMYIVVLLIIRRCSINIFVQLILCVIASVIIIGLAPVGNKNNKLDNMEVEVYKSRTRNILVIELLAYMILLTLNFEYWCAIIVLSEILTSVLLCFGTLQNTLG